MLVVTLLVVTLLVVTLLAVTLLVVTLLVVTLLAVTLLAVTLLVVATAELKSNEDDDEPLKNGLGLMGVGMSAGIALPNVKTRWKNS